MNTAKDTAIALQNLLGVIPDGRIGSQTEAAFYTLKDTAPADVWPPAGIIAGTLKTLPSALPWTAVIDENDLVVHNVIATCFGGKHDAGDTGHTESGVLNNGTDPDLLGVALPIRSGEAATQHSPIAFNKHIPWGTLVKVWKEADGESTAITCKLIDNGPNVAKYPTHALDLTPAAAAHFAVGANPTYLANEWEGKGFSYRILGGAQWIS